ncbi:MAG TPA: formate dehydrogenase accessory sulfurtransferase FdhD, partial [Methanocorpusculum sp.]|nr:formate dehydrogenase accessory sulfurtransferase FdhD [Methanocorpusculum sp.]
DCFVGVTGRIFSELVRKIYNANIPVIASRSAVTAQCIELSRIMGLTLIGFVRDRNRFTIYSLPERVTGLDNYIIPINDLPKYQNKKTVTQIHGLKYSDNNITITTELVVTEVEVTVYLNEKELIKLVASPENLCELAVGYCVSVGVIHTLDDIVSITENKCSVYIKTQTTIPTKHIHELTEKPDNYHYCIEPNEIFEIQNSIDNNDNHLTGGIHCAGLCYDHSCKFMACDIGRHNTIDKIIGYIILNKINPLKCMIGCSGRQTTEIIRKIANIGIPIIVSRAATTNKGIQTAKLYGITLICFARSPRYTVYTNQHRVIG